MSDYVHASVACRLPGEIMLDILSRLPVKTIIKCKLICKSWHDVITNPVFIDMHFRQPSDLREADSYIVIRRKARVTTMYTFNTHGETVCESIGGAHYGLFICLGSCRGVLFMIPRFDSPTFGKSFLLFNPATREHKHVKYEPREEMMKAKSKVISLGAGIDSRTNDYKIVRIEQFNVNDGQLQSQCDVYSTASGSWRSVEARVDGVIWEKMSRTFVDGALHWVAKREDNPNIYFYILSFNVSEETFRAIWLPNPESIQISTLQWHVNKFNERLAVIYYNDPPRNRFDVWYMREYGVRESWTRGCIFNYAPEDGLCFLVAGGRNGRFVYANQDKNDLYCHHPEEGNKKIEVPGFLKTNNLDVLNYKESLVTFNGSTLVDMKSVLEVKGINWRKVGSKVVVGLRYIVTFVGLGILMIFLDVLVVVMLAKTFDHMGVEYEVVPGGLYVKGRRGRINRAP